MTEQRKPRRLGQPGALELLEIGECERMLEATPIGRVGFDFAGRPVILPVTYRFVDGSIVLRTVLGQKLHAAAAHRAVAFEIDRWDPVLRTGWSVLVKGHAEEITDRAGIERADQLGLEPWADHEVRDRWVRIVPDEITGRRIN